MTTSPHTDIHRRTFLSRSGVSLGAAALSGLLQQDAQALPAGATNLPHHPPKIRRVIFLCMAGGPSHLETFDYKPKLAEMDGQPMPDSFTKNKPIAQLQGQKLKCQGPLTKFREFGKNGQTLVLRPGRKYEEVAINKFDRVSTVPLFVGKRMYLRTDRALYCIGE